MQGSSVSLVWLIQKGPFKHAGQLSLTRPINCKRGKKRTEGETEEWGSLVSDYTLYRLPSLLVTARLPSDFLNLQEAS